MNLLQEAKALEPQLIQWRRALHQMPEIGLNLPKTSAYVQEQLKGMGIPFQLYGHGSAIVATVGQGERVIALRADMDALAVPEETGLPYASKNGNMHACGHDGHTTMLLGAAQLLKAHEGELKGTVKLFFQHGEEICEGAPEMIQEGALTDHHVQCMYALHGQPNTQYPSGTVLVSDGNMMASADFFDIRVKGKGCHGAMPESGVDPVVIAAQVIQAIQTMMAREISSQESAVLSLCSLRSRTADEEQYQKVYNVIPNCVEIAGTLRTLNSDVQHYILARMEEIVTGICSTARATGELKVKHVAPVLHNPKANAQELYESACKVLGEDQVVYCNKPSMGSEDAAYFLQEVPGNYFNLVSYAPIDGAVHPLHNSKFCLDEHALHHGVAVLVQGAMDWLEKGE